MKQESNLLDATFSVIALAVGIAFWVLIPLQVEHQENAYGITSRFFPTLTAMLIAGAGVLLLVRSLFRPAPRDREEAPGFRWEEVRRILPYMVIVFVYVAAMEGIGYLTTTIPALLVLLVWSGSRNPLVVAGITVVVPVVLYLFFQKVMEVPLPEGLAL